MSFSGQGPRLSLHITISALFMALVLSLGALLSVQSYNRSSDIILSSAERLYRQISAEVQLDFKATYSPVAKALELLALSPVVDAQDGETRIRNLPLLVAALDEGGAVSGIQVGYPNGDYFIVRPLDSDELKGRFKAPPNARYVVDNIGTGDAAGSRLSRSYYDDSLGLLRQDTPVETTYDPRKRPWYLQAGLLPSAVQPYLFHFIGKVGTTVTVKTGRPGVVLATDISLEQLSNTIARYRTTPGSEVVLFGTDGGVLAYHDRLKMTDAGAGNDLGIAHISALGNPVLGHVGKFPNLQPRRLDFEYQGRRWIGSIEKIAQDSGLDLKILLISPVDELLVDAAAIRRSFLVTTMVILALSIPVVWLVAGRIAGPMRCLAEEAEAIRRFDFESPLKTRSFISEVDSLADAMRIMKTTINKFLTLINALAGEKEFGSLLTRITRETLTIGHAAVAVVYLIDDEEMFLRAETLQAADGRELDIAGLPAIPLHGQHPLAERLDDRRPGIIEIGPESPATLAPLLGLLAVEQASLVTVPLRSRHDQAVGILCMLYPSDGTAVDMDEHAAQLAFIDALSGFAAVSIESRHLFEMQEALLDAFIKLIAGAIDAKSPYTGGHCQRVPALTAMLARAACDSTEPQFADYKLDDEGWKALHIASWLHDCGKVTTPEYVVDKSTKLETIYDRIHEIRMRFEVLKRDAEIRFWEQLADGGDREVLRQQLDTTLARLDDDFAFVAECNQGGEFMAPERLQRLQEIAANTWMRTLDDRIGISWEERQRKERLPSPELPAPERLIDDKPEHLIEHAMNDRIPADNPWGFRLDVPEYKYNRGELYNLSVTRGTLSEEERFKINDHVVQTIIMLGKLPYPKHLRQVPEIAGGHHETMDGKGYPKRLTRDDTSLNARIMAIADIFEALTASDRPYKKAKTLSESIRILSFMKKDAHIDPDLFDLFLQSGIWKTYAQEFLDAEQIDEVDVGQYLN